MSLLAAAAYVVGLLWVLHMGEAGGAALYGLVAPLAIGAVIARWWASALAAAALAPLLALLALFPPGAGEPSARGIGLLLAAGTVIQAGLLAGGVALRRLLAHFPKPRVVSVEPPPRPLRLLRLALATATSLLVAALVLLSLTLFLPPSFGILSARNWTRPLPDDDRALPVISGHSEESRIEPTFGRIASWMAYEETEVRCWSEDDWRYRPPFAGYFRGASQTIHLPPRVCSRLVGLAYGDGVPTTPVGSLELARSVQGLAHESMHAAGYWNEAEAECYGMQSIRWTAERLGASPEQARDLARVYWLERYRNIRDTEYRSSECRDGGRLDVDRGSPAWP